MIYVMSDIHGMYDKYKKMLEMINFNDNDTLYVLGDVIDRGDGSIKILQDMMARSNVYGLIGNHELMAVECLKWLATEITEASINELDEEKLVKLSDWLNNGAYQTIQEFQALSRTKQQDIIDYLLEFVAYEEVFINDKYYLLVHAGIDGGNFGKSLDDYDIDDFVWNRPDLEIPYFNDDRHFMIIGHTPTLLLNGKVEIIHQNNYIAIDCGACFNDGKLACLCLDTMEDFYV